MPPCPPSAPEDQLFATFCRSGDAAALAEVYRLTLPGLRQFALRRSRDPALAEDALQEAFVCAIENRDRFEAGRPFRPWILGILKNSLYKQQQRQALGRSALGEEPRAPDAEPLEGLLRGELRRRVAVAIHRLPLCYQPVLQMRLLEGWSNQAVATALGRSLGTVRIQMMRGLQALRRELPGSGALLVLASALAAQPRRSGSRLLRPGYSSRATLLAAGVVLTALFGGHWLSERQHPRAGTITPTAAGRAMNPLAPATAPARSRLIPAIAASASDPTATLRLRLRYHDSRPAAGVWLRLRPRAGANPYLRDRWMQTDSEGCVAVAVERHVSYQLQGLRSADLGLVSAAAGTVDLSLPQGLRLEGQVLGPQNEVMAGAAVWMSLGADPSQGRVLGFADSMGRFAVEGVVGPRYLGAQDVTGRLAASCLVRSEDKVEHPQQLRLQLLDPGVDLRGRVLGPDGRGIPFAQVLVGRLIEQGMVTDALGKPRRGPPPQVVEADRQGRYLLQGLPAGRCQILARAPGWFGQIRHTVLRGPTPNACVLRLQRAEIRGRVVDPQGQPVGGARVIGAGLADHAAGLGLRSGADGTFCLPDGLLGPQWMVASAPGWGTCRQQLRVLGGVATECVLQLLPPSPGVHGRLIGPDAEPLPGWKVDARAHPPQPGSASQWMTRTDSQGRFGFSELGATELSIRVLPPSGTAPCGAAHRVFPRAAPWQLRLSAAEMPRAGLRGQVRGCLSGAELCLSRMAWVAQGGIYQDHQRLPLEQDGHFLVRGLAPGPYRLHLYRPGHEPLRVEGLQLKAGQTRELGVLGQEKSGRAKRPTR